MTATLRWYLFVGADPDTFAILLAAERRGYPAQPTNRTYSAMTALCAAARLSAALLDREGRRTWVPAS